MTRNLPHLTRADGLWVVLYNRGERRQIGPALLSFSDACTFARYLAKLWAERAGEAS